MDFRLLRYFIAVYEERSLSRAAKRCLVAQPSISTAIRQLESELDQQLFIRHPKGASPTLAGKALYPYAVKVFQDVRNIKGLFKKRENVPKVPITLGLMPFLSGQYVGLIVRELLKSLPGLDLTVTGWDEDTDARIISSSMSGKNEIFRKLWTDAYVLAMPKGHPLSAKKTLTLEDINGLPFVSRTFCDALDTWNFAVQTKGIELDIRATVSTEEYALDLVAAGLGISLVPGHSAGCREDIVIRSVTEPKLERIVGLAYSTEYPLPFRLLTAVERARDLIADASPPLIRI